MIKSATCNSLKLEQDVLEKLYTTLWYRMLKTLKEVKDPPEADARDTKG